MRQDGEEGCVREVKGIEKMSMLGAGRGAWERGGRRLEVEVNSKRRSPGHDVSDLVLETVEVDSPAPEAAAAKERGRRQSRRIRAL